MRAQIERELEGQTIGVKVSSMVLPIINPCPSFASFVLSAGRAWDRSASG